MIATPYIVENAIIGPLAVLALAFAIYQLFIDYTTEREQHKLLKITHVLTFVGALALVFVQCDPKALYGVFPQVAVNVFKHVLVSHLQMSAQSLLVTYLFALTKSSLGKRPVYLIRALRLSSLIYGVSLLVLVVVEASLQKRYFEGVPLLCESLFCAYLGVFAMYATTDLRRALMAHISATMDAAPQTKFTDQTKAAIKKVRKVQIFMSVICLAAMTYQFVIAVGLLQQGPSLPTHASDPSTYPITAPMANIISLACITGMLYAAYYPRQSTGKRTPSALSLEKTPSKATMEKSPSTRTLQVDKSSGAVIEPALQSQSSIVIAIPSGQENS